MNKADYSNANTSEHHLSFEAESTLSALLGGVLARDIESTRQFFDCLTHYLRTKYSRKLSFCHDETIREDIVSEVKLRLLSREMHVLRSLRHVENLSGLLNKVFSSIYYDTFRRKRLPIDNCEYLKLINVPDPGPHIFDTVLQDRLRAIFYDSVKQYISEMWETDPKRRNELNILDEQLVKKTNAKITARMYGTSPDNVYIIVHRCTMEMVALAIKQISKELEKHPTAYKALEKMGLGDSNINDASAEVLWMKVQETSYGSLVMHYVKEVYADIRTNAPLNWLLITTTST